MSLGGIRVREPGDKLPEENMYLDLRSCLLDSSKQGLASVDHLFIQQLLLQYWESKSNAVKKLSPVWTLTKNWTSVLVYDKYRDGFSILPGSDFRRG